MSDDEDGGGEVIELDLERPKRGKGKHSSKVEKSQRAKRIPTLPEPGTTSREIELARRDSKKRSVACVNLRIEGTPWPEVVELLEYTSVQAARADFHRALADMHPAEDAETVRRLAALSAEQLFRRSLRMASADYFVDADDPEHKIPNTDRIRWHDQANRDLALWTTITGAKAPVKLEHDLSGSQIEALLDKMLAGSDDLPVLEAEVLDLDDLPDEPEMD